MTFTPRPTSEDIDRKYSYLHNHYSAKTENTTVLPSDNIRSSELYAYTASFIEGKVAEILDFGGGNGRLLPPFINAGHKCSIVDYVTDTLSGVSHIGNTIDEIPENRKFDLIICNHVLEHLAEPREVVKKLVRHLSENGILYAEVPLEIWNTVPLPLEPVTHINFFSPLSMKALLQLSGMQVLSCMECTFTSLSGELAFAVRAVSRLADDKNAGVSDFQGNAAASKKLIKPNIYQRMLHFYRYPRYYRQEIKRWGRSHIPYFWRFISFP